MNPSPKAGAPGETVSVKGKVLDAAGSPAANINVPIFVGSTKVAEPTTNADGVFSADLTSTTTGDVVYKFGSPDGFVQGEWTIKWLTPVQVDSVVFDGHMPASALITDTVELSGVVMADVSNVFTGDTILDLYVDNLFHSPVLVEGGVFKQILEPGDGSTGYHVVNSGQGGSTALGVFHMKWNDPAKMPTEIIVKQGAPTIAVKDTNVMVYLDVKGPGGAPLGDISFEWFADGVSQGDTYVYSDGTCEVRLWNGTAGSVVYTFGDPSLGDKQGRHTVEWVDSLPKVIKVAEITPDKCHPSWKYPVTAYIGGGPDSVVGQSVEFWLDGAKVHTASVTHEDGHITFDCTNPAGTQPTTKTMEVRWGELKATKELVWTSDLGARNVSKRFTAVSYPTNAAYTDVGIPTDLNGAFTPNARVGLYDFETATYYDLTKTYDENNFFHGSIPGKEDGTYRIGLVLEGWSGVNEVTWAWDANPIVGIEFDTDLTGQGNMGIEYHITGKFKDPWGGYVTDINDTGLWMKFVDINGDMEADRYADFANGKFDFGASGWAEGQTTVMLGLQDGAYLGSHQINFGPALPNVLGISKVSATKGVTTAGMPATMIVTCADAGGGWLGGESIEVYDASDMNTVLETVVTKNAGWGIFQHTASAAGDVTYVFKNGDVELRHTVTWSDGSESIGSDFSPFYFDGKIRSGKTSRIRGKVVDQDYAPIERACGLWLFNKKTMEDVDLSAHVNDAGMFDFELDGFVTGGNACIIGTEFASRNFTINSGALNPDVKSIKMDPMMPNTVQPNVEFAFSGTALDSNGNTVKLSTGQNADIDFGGNSWTLRINTDGSVTGNITFDTLGVNRGEISAVDSAYLGSVNFTVNSGWQLNSKPYGSVKAAVGDPLKPALRLTGDATDNSGHNFQIEVVNQLDEVIHSTSAVTDENGDLKPTIVAQPEGVYTIRYTNGNFVLETFAEWTSDPVGTDLLSVPDTLNLDLSLPADITGRVVDQNGAAFNARDLIVFNHDTNQMVPYTLVKNDVDGFKLSIAPIGVGEHHLVVATENKRVSVHTTWTKQTDAVTTVSLDNPTPIVGDIGGVCTVAGKVLSQYDTNMVGETVTITGTGADLNMVTTADGYTFDIPSDGRTDGELITYRIACGDKFVEANITWMEPPVLTDIGVDPYNRQMAVTEAAVDIRGRLKDAKGWAFIPSAPVTFEIRNGSDVWHTVTTEADGRWSVTDRHAVEGEFLLTAHIGDKQIGEIHQTRKNNVNLLNPTYLTRFRASRSKRIPITLFATDFEGTPTDATEVEFYLADGDVKIGSTWPSYGDARGWVGPNAFPEVTEPTKIKVYAKFKGATERCYFQMEALPESANWGVSVSNVVYPTPIPDGETVTVTGNVTNSDGDEVTDAIIQLYHVEDMWPLDFDLIKHDANGFVLSVPYYYPGRSTVEVAGDEGYTETGTIKWA